ncbi:autotransporter domain-containing protein [Bradyrhizobium sp. INPA01-394B]|uniref:autotransporter outer membrane beta-barrel domain-containing protein n=1 Tax=Bradyrhizobium campsiandrae TaxID=1729892 RepID=UPI00165F6CF1|nr:autotransporter outer membrane beta-barrel domain-containing protein [Bradyrhizobium campsiandrae]MBC9876891.1 autotransporter domain-containing protein [Bradyrhizobium campsiandrae]
MTKMTVVAAAAITTSQRKRTRAALLAACSTLALMIPAAPSSAQTDTWKTNNGRGIYNAGTNWNTGLGPTGTAFFGTSNQTAIAIAADASVGGWTLNSGASSYQATIGANVTLSFTGAGIAANGGSISIATSQTGTLYFTNNSSAGTATISNAGSTGFFNNSTAGNATVGNAAAATMYFFDASTAGSAVFTNQGGLYFVANSSAGNAVIDNQSFLALSNNATAGNAAITNNATASTDFSLSSGPAGNHQLSAGSIAGGGFFQLGSNQLTVGGNNFSTTVSGLIRDGGGGGGTGGWLGKIGNGIRGLTGANTYTGATTVNGGTLWVDGSIATSSLTTVNNGAWLVGAGTIGNTQVNAGGLLGPGNGTPTTSLTVAGNLAFQAGALYLIGLNPSTASFTTVSGTATLNGATVQAAFLTGSYVSKQYTILTATGGLSGTFASVIANNNLPAGFHDTLSYDANNVYLNLALGFAGPSYNAMNQNHQADADALVGDFNSTGGIPAVYGSLTPAGLTQASGESAAGSQQATFDAMSQFMGLLTDPFMRNSNCRTASPSQAACGDAPAGAIGYADDRRADAYAMFTKAPLRGRPFEQRWSVWAAGFGGTQTTEGNAIVGSSQATSRIFGTAVGADYLISPSTLAGFALAGGGTSFGVSGLGGGRSDLFQAGAYVHHTSGPAYVTAALAYGWQDVTTDRTVTIAGADRLRAEFNANAWSGRLEGGYRYDAPWIGGVVRRPYAAEHATTIPLPTYAEQVISGAPAFALNYAAKDVTDARSELGLRSDKSFAQQSGVLTLRGRLAWAHDFNPNRTIAATFQALPGASFVVNGAAQARDSALTTASAEMKWLNGWSAAATFEGEFSQVTRSYAGKGVVRYAW